MLTLKLAWRSFARHKRRSAITAAAIALGLAMLLASIGLATDGHARMAELGIRLGAGHVVVQGRGYQERQTADIVVPDPDRVARAARAIPGARHAARRVYASGLLASGHLSAAVMVAGVDPRIEPDVSDIASADHRVRGRYLRPRDARDFASEPADVYIGDQLARTLAVDVGDRVVLTVAPSGNGEPAATALRIAGIFHTGVDELDGFYAQIPLADAQELLGLGRAVTQVAVFADDLRAVDRITAALRATFGADSALEILPWQQALRELYEAIVLDDLGNYLMHAIVFAIVAIGIFNTVLMSVVERTREFGVMMAIGASRTRMFAVVLSEAAILAIVACAAGVAIALALHGWLSTTGLDVSQFYGEDFEFAGIAFRGRIYSTLYPSQVAGWTAAVFAIVLASALYPALRATRLEPVEAMRHA
ncbi:MAG: ABC transporter permease [Deltaproteobacteria bacterium]|nr:MAG: ABC transporter permease [Deltaproteobacteria bacterium]